MDAGPARRRGRSAPTAPSMSTAWTRHGPSTRTAFQRL